MRRSVRPSAARRTRSPGRHARPVRAIDARPCRAVRRRTVADGSPRCRRPDDAEGARAVLDRGDPRRPTPGTRAPRARSRARGRRRATGAPTGACASPQLATAPGTVIDSGPRIGIAVHAGRSDRVDVARRAPAGAVERDEVRARRVPHEPERVAADPAGAAHDDGEHGVRGDRGVHGAATRPEDPEPRRRGEVMGRDDRAGPAARERRGDERPAVGQGGRRVGSGCGAMCRSYAAAPASARSRPAAPARALGSLPRAAVRPSADDAPSGAALGCGRAALALGRHRGDVHAPVQHGPHRHDARLLPRGAAVARWRARWTRSCSASTARRSSSRSSSSRRRSAAWATGSATTGSCSSGRSSGSSRSSSPASRRTSWLLGVTARPRGRLDAPSSVPSILGLHRASRPPATSALRGQGGGPVRGGDARRPRCRPRGRGSALDVRSARWRSSSTPGSTCSRGSIYRFGVVDARADHVGRSHEHRPGSVRRYAGDPPRRRTSGCWRPRGSP